MDELIAKKFHRIRFYEDGWSNFDTIDECEKPGFCIGCAYKHPFCTETGRVIVSNDDALRARSTQERG